jgi:hypothetical protein
MTRLEKCQKKRHPAKKATCFFLKFFFNALSSLSVRDHVHQSYEAVFGASIFSAIISQWRIRQTRVFNCLDNLNVVSGA